MAKSRYNEIYYRKIKKAPPRNVYLERFFEYLEGGLKNYGVNTCCLLFPLRKGLLIIGYFNIFFDMILIVGAATGTISPLFIKIQESLEQEPSISVGVAVPATELAFTVVLLCATHRNDVGLLRFYMVYGCVAIGLTVVSYAVVMVNLSLFFVFALVASVSYQAYIILLVRSLVVKIRQAKCEVRMMSLKELLNRKEIDVEAPAPVHRPVPKDAGPGPLAAIVGNPKVEIILKSEPADDRQKEVKTVTEIKKDTEIMAEKVKNSYIEIKNKEDIDQLNKEKKEDIKAERPLQEKDANANGVLNAILGIKQVERNKDRQDKESKTEASEKPKDKDSKKSRKVIFGRKSIDSNITAEKETHQTTETNEVTKDKQKEKPKKTFFGLKKKDINKTNDILSKKEAVPESADVEVSKPEVMQVKQDANDKNLNRKNEETQVVVEIKLTSNDDDKNNKPETKNQTKPIKEKRKIQKQTNGTDEMEEIKLDVDTGTERKESVKLETIEEEPRRKWFWKK